MADTPYTCPVVDAVLAALDTEITVGDETGKAIDLIEIGLVRFGRSGPYVNGLEDAMETLRGAAGDLRDEVDTATELAEDLQKDLDEAEGTVSDLNDRIRELEHQVEELDDQLDDALSEAAA